MGRNTVIFAMMLLLCIAGASALWSPAVSSGYMGVNNNMLAGDYNVRVLEVDLEGRGAVVQITKSRTTVFQGVITQDSGYTKSEDIMIKARDFRYYDPARPEVRFDVRRWVEGKLSVFNFPSRMYKNDAYKVFAVVENTGDQKAGYRLSLSAPQGLHIVQGTQDAPVNYQSQVKTPSRQAEAEFSLQPGESRKIYFVAQPLSREADLAEPVFELQAESGTPIDIIRVGEVPFTSEMVGYIPDVIVNQGMFSGRQEPLTVKVRNSWLGASNDFFVRLIAPEFKVVDSIKQIRAFPQRTETVDFSVTPFGGGDFTIIAELSIGSKVVHTLPVDVKVLGDKVYKIKSVEAPSRLEKGETGQVTVAVENNAVSQNTLSLSLSSEDASITTPEAVLKLGPESSTRVMFSFKPVKDGRVRLDVELHDIPEKYYTSLYRKKGKLIDSRVLYVDVGQKPTGDGLSGRAGSSAGDDTAEPAGTDTGKTDRPAEQEPPDENLQDGPAGKDGESTEDEAAETLGVEELWPYLLGGISIIVAIIAAAAVAGRSNKQKNLKTKPKGGKYKKKK